MTKRILGWTIAVAVVVAASVGLWLNRYNLQDWLQLRGYTPTTAIANLATDSGLNEYGRRLFYVNDPQLSDRQKFNTECTSSEQTIVLGCFTGHNIYVFDISDPRLQGVEEVTAAHEMLHAAYDRLSAGEKNRINTLLQTTYTNLNDPHLNEVVASYSKTEPGQELNELHSILGTEYGNLSPELETYYSKYFSDRAKVVSQANAYKKVFEDIEAQVASYDADLANRKADINQRESSLQDQLAQLNDQKSRMDAYLQAGNNSAYNSEVPSYNARVNSYNTQLNTLRQLIVEYNQIVVARNNLALQQQGLAQSLDSRLNTL